MTIECWVTTLAGVYLAHLDRSQASPFRRFAVSRMRGADPGVGSLEYHRNNALLAATPTLFANSNLVWMKYNGRTLTWIIEDRKAVLDQSENATDWIAVSGRGVKQLLGDRIVWPSEFSETDLDPALWGLGGWSTKLDADAAAAQSVVPVTSTVGAVVGIPVRITGRPVGAGAAGHTVGIIQSINAGVSITLEDDLPVSFRKGSRILGATQQWRRFVNKACGELIWNLLDESNSRFEAQIVRGTIDVDTGWTQDFRFDNLLDVVKSVVAAYGDIDMDGLTFNYRSAPGTDRSATVIFEEGADVLKVERAESDRDTISWVVAEGVGEGSTASLAVAKDVAITRRREAYLDAKDAGNLPLVQLRADAAIDELAPIDSIALEVTAERFAPFADYDLGDTVRVVALSRNIDQAAVIVGMYLAETDDERVRVGIDVNSPRTEYLTRLADGNRSTARSLQVGQRQPQGQLVPFAFSGADVFDDTDTMDVLVYVPDEMYVCTRARAFLRFREFFASAKTAASSGSLTSDSGGGSTSGSSSASSSGSTSGTDHFHGFGMWNSNTPGAFSSRKYDAVNGSGIQYNLETSSTGALETDSTGLNGHIHGIAHTHSTPNHQHTVPGHTHGLTYGVYKEAYPASHSVTLKVYNWDDDAAWDLVATISGITTDTSDQDLTAYITGPGIWRLELKSAAAQPNGGRLGCDVSGFVLGALQSA